MVPDIPSHFLQVDLRPNFVGTFSGAFRYVSRSSQVQGRLLKVKVRRDDLSNSFIRINAGYTNPTPTFASSTWLWHYFFLFRSKDIEDNRLLEKVCFLIWTLFFKFCGSMFWINCQAFSFPIHSLSDWRYFKCLFEGSELTHNSSIRRNIIDSQRFVICRQINYL